MNKGTIQAFAAGIILTTAVVAAYEHWLQPEHGQTLSIEDATTLLTQKGYTVTTGIKEDKTKAKVPEAKETSEKQLDDKKEETTSNKQDAKKEDNQASQSVQNETKAVSYKLSIHSGMTSIEIASLLEKEGIVDAKALEQYLEQNALNKEIQIGEYELTSKMTIQQLAKTITQ